jgi:hypothetical protein
LKTLLLHDKTREEDISQSFYASTLEMNIPIHKLVSVTTNGAPTTNSKNNGLRGFCKKDLLPLTFLICARNLQHMSWLSKHMLDENDAHHREIILHASFILVQRTSSSHSGSSSGQK